MQQHRKARMPAPILQRRWHTIANQIPNMLICSAVEIMIYSVAQNYLDDGSYPELAERRGTRADGKVAELAAQALRGGKL
jgi:hypothetical protein